MNFENLNPANYQAMLDEKSTVLTNLFSEFKTPTLEVFPSAPLHYRMRAEFRIWHDQEDIYYYMFNQETKMRIRIEEFPIASEIINNVMKDLISEIKYVPSLRHKLFEVDFLSTLSNEILVTFIYHRQLDNEWIELARNLKNKLNQKYKLNIVGRARKQKIVIDEDFVIERLSVSGKELVYKQVENSFTQPNAGVDVKMLEWAQGITKNAQGDLLELYCGNGNFSIALSPHFNKVLATELSSSSVDSAQFNIEINGIQNLKILRMSAEDFSSAIKGEREFFRLKDTNLKEYNCNTILVDPPRSGLDESTVEMVSNYESIIYISCNPNTLIDNLKILTKTHTISRFALFDQFPYTEHMECGVLLEKIK